MGEGVMTLMSEAEISEFQDAFFFLDKDGDGYITVEELGNAVKWLAKNPTDEDVESMMRQVDEVGQGRINFERFVGIMARKAKEAEADEEEIKQAFRVFDIDENGLISPAELRSGMMKTGVKVSDEELEQMIGVADLDGDGKVNYLEFLTVTMKFAL